MELYRQQLHTTRLYTFDEQGRRVYTSGLDGRGKKNHKTTDLVLTALYFFLAVESVQGNTCILVANDEDQANDDLGLTKKLITASPALAAEVDIQQKQIVRKDGQGLLRIVPARDAAGLHGKTYIFLGVDEMHAYKNYDVLEALSPDPHRTDYFILIATYASVFNSPGYPLYDYYSRGVAGFQGKAEGADPRMHFSWYSADLCTDAAFASLPAEQRANPSMQSWADKGYLEQQKRRLPVHKYRRLHLNLPGMPDGAYLQPEAVFAAIKEGRKNMLPLVDLPEGRPPRYYAFVDMSGGSQDDAVLGIAYREGPTTRLVQLVSQTTKPPFNPRHAVAKFVPIIKQYGLAKVTGDNYAGNTFASDFGEHGIGYNASALTRSELYEAVEPLLNAGRLELLDEPKLQEQLLGLIRRGEKIDHQPGEHDDYANAAAGACVLAHKGGEHRASETILISRSQTWDGYADTDAIRDRHMWEAGDRQW